MVPEVGHFIAQVKPEAFNQALDGVITILTGTSGRRGGNIDCNKIGRVVLIDTPELEVSGFRCHPGKAVPAILIRLSFEYCSAWKGSCLSLWKMGNLSCAVAG